MHPAAHPSLLPTATALLAPLLAARRYRLEVLDGSAEAATSAVEAPTAAAAALPGAAAAGKGAPAATPKRKHPSDSVDGGSAAGCASAVGHAAKRSRAAAAAATPAAAAAAAAAPGTTPHGGATPSPGGAAQKDSNEIDAMLKMRRELQVRLVIMLRSRLAVTMLLPAPNARTRPWLLPTNGPRPHAGFGR